MPDQEMLAPYRVLDLADEKGFLCGKILADLGADVIKVEKPGGEASRNIEPFYHDIPHPEKSLYWFAHNLNKRSVTLDIETADGREIFKRLVRTADIVIECFPPGYMNGLGLGYTALSEIKPSIVVTSISPFGQKGPYRDYRASDLTLTAMGGLLYITGYPEQPPVRVTFPQAWLLAGANAASSTMVALYHSQSTGEGQHVDISIQSSIAWAITNTVPLWELNNINLKRQGSVLSGRFGTTANQRIIWPCRDGFVAFILFGGSLGLSMGNLQLVAWLEEEGLADDFISGFDWASYDMATSTQEEQNHLESYVAKLFAKYTKLELYQQGLQRDIKIFPAYSPKDLTQDPQLKSREFWMQVEHPELADTITYPGVFFRASEAPYRLRHRPPLVGEHNREVYRELGISNEELMRLKQANVI